MKLGKYIEPLDERNPNLAFNYKNVMGLSINKTFIETKVTNVNIIDLKRYKIIRKNYFAYCTVTSRNGNKITVAYNDTNDDFIISNIYPVFKVKDETKLLPQYLMMFFRRSEFDRYARFNSWGSARETFSWEDMCNIELTIPPIQTQKKYVAIYEGLLNNLKCYQNRLEDLKLVCDGYIEDLRKKYPVKKIGKYINIYNHKNTDNKCSNVMGISVNKYFREPTSKVDRDNLSNYKIVKPRQISFVQTTHNEKVFACALNNTKEDILVSSVNEVFYTDEKNLLPEYLFMFFSRKEFDRYARFHSWGSAREIFTFEDLCDVKIPIPSIKIQQSIVNLFGVYNKRKEFVEKLKLQIKNICPILIKGSLEEAKAS